MRSRPAGKALAVLVLAAATLAVGCTGGPRGIDGTWERPLAGGHSRIVIEYADSEPRVLWSKIDGNQIVDCDDDGACRESVDGEPVYAWDLRPFHRERGGDLFLEVHGRPLAGEVPAVQFVDRLELRPGGDELWSWTIEKDGVAQVPPAGPIRFRRVSVPAR